MGEAFHRHLKRREIYAQASTRWRNPQAQLLEGQQWETVKDDVLTSLGLPADPEALLDQHVATLDAAYAYVGARLADNTDVRVDDAGKIHVTSHNAIEEPPSLIDLRKRVAAMLPRVDIGEAGPGGDGLGPAVHDVADRPVRFQGLARQTGRHRDRQPGQSALAAAAAAIRASPSDTRATARTSSVVVLYPTVAAVPLESISATTDSICAQGRMQTGFQRTQLGNQRGITALPHWWVHWWAHHRRRHGSIPQRGTDKT